MAHRVATLSGGRKLLLSSPNTRDDFGVLSPFVVLAPAFNETERSEVLAIVGSLIDQGCIEFCCAGPQSEFLHDAIDEIVEDRKRPDLITTWHTDASDACEYFLFAAGGQANNLLALVACHPELQDLLKGMAGWE